MNPIEEADIKSSWAQHFPKRLVNGHSKTVCAYICLILSHKAQHETAGGWRAGYFIKDLREHTPSFHSTIRNWLRGHRDSDNEFVTYGFELGDVKELSKRSRARRSKQGQLIQFSDLSNILRTIGAYLDSQEAELVELHKRPISITLVYRDKSRHEHREERPVSSFYSFFLELHEKRNPS